MARYCINHGSCPDQSLITGPCSINAQSMLNPLLIQAQSIANQLGCLKVNRPCLTSGLANPDQGSSRYIIRRAQDCTLHDLGAQRSNVDKYYA